MGNKPTWKDVKLNPDIKVATWIINGSEFIEFTITTVPVTGGWLYEAN